MGPPPGTRVTRRTWLAPTVRRRPRLSMTHRDEGRRPGSPSCRVCAQSRMRSAANSTRKSTFLYWPRRLGWWRGGCSQRRSRYRRDGAAAVIPRASRHTRVQDTPDGRKRRVRCHHDGRGQLPGHRVRQLLRRSGSGQSSRAHGERRDRYSSLASGTRRRHRGQRRTDRLRRLGWIAEWQCPR